MFETLGERTLALAQLQRRENPDAGLHAPDRGVPAADPRALPRGADPDRRQLRRRQPAGRRRPDRRARARARARGTPRRGRPRRRPADLCARGDDPVLARHRGHPARRRAGPGGERLPRRVARSPSRSGSAPTSSSSAAARIRRSRSGRSSTSSAGARTTGIASPRARSPATCSSAAPRSRGGYFADPGFKDVPGLARDRLSDRRGGRRRHDGHHQGRRHRRPGLGADGQGAAALRAARPVGVPGPGRDARRDGGRGRRRGRAGPRARDRAPAAGSGRRR